MDWKVIKTKAQYKKAIKRTMEIFQAAGDTPEADELDLLLVLVKDYEDKHIVLPDVDPIDAIKLKMEERGFCPPLINTNLYLEKSCGGFSLAFCKNQIFQV
jgi:antitoxin component HigA of HigAB toxin-antitoxin module